MRSWPHYTLTGLFYWLQPATIAEIWQDAETTTLILFYMDVMESVAVGLDADTTFIPHTKGAVLDWWLEATWAQWTSFSSWNQFEMTWALWHGSNNSMQWSLNTQTLITSIDASLENPLLQQNSDFGHFWWIVALGIAPGMDFLQL